MAGTAGAGQLVSLGRQPGRKLQRWLIAKPRLPHPGTSGQPHSLVQDWRISEFFLIMSFDSGEAELTGHLGKRDFISVFSSRTVSNKAMLSGGSANYTDAPVFVVD